jgi:surface polysaccharide O-acyltransferase-like enzyme
MKRENGADLFRIMGMLFVNMLHAYLYNGFYYEAQEGFAMWAANSTRWLVYGCNAMFMLLTGYLKTTSPFGKRYYKSLVAVLVGYVLTCVVSYPIRYFCIGERDPLPVWID